MQMSANGAPGGVAHDPGSAGPSPSPTAKESAPFTAAAGGVRGTRGRGISAPTTMSDFLTPAALKMQPMHASSLAGAAPASAAATATVAACGPPPSETPSQTRLRSLAAKISSIQSKAHEHRRAQGTTLSHKVSLLDSKLSRVHRTEAGKVEGIRHQVEELTQVVERERIALQALDDRKRKELTLVQSNVALELGLQRQSRLEAEERMAKLIQEKFAAMGAEIEHQREVRERQETALSGSMNEEVAACHRKLHAELEQTATTMEEHRATAEQGCERLRKLLEDEVAQREESERNIMAMLEDAFTRLSGSVEEERMDREATQEMMLKLMEETCVSVEKHIAS